MANNTFKINLKVIISRFPKRHMYLHLECIYIRDFLVMDCIKIIELLSNERNTFGYLKCKDRKKLTTLNFISVNSILFLSKNGHR